MKQWTKLGGRLLALALVLCMGASLLPVAPVLAQEDSAAETTVADAAEPAEETEQAAPAEEQAAEESNSDDTTGGAVPADVAVSEENAAEGAESAVEVSTEPAGSVKEEESTLEDSTVEPEQPGSSVSGEDSAEPEDSLAETLPEGIEAIDEETAAPTEADAFGLEVSFAGQTLQEKTTNAISTQWDVTTAQSLQVALKRDTAVELEDSENKQYVLCLKTTKGFYFTTLPEIEKIDGAEVMEFVPNTAEDGTELEPYSGEIRIQVDPEKNVNIGVLGVKVSDTVAAAAGTGLTVQSPVSVELVTADSSLTLKDIKDTDKTKVHGYSVDTAQLVDLTAVSTAEEEETVPDGIEPIDEEDATGEEETVEVLDIDETAAFQVAVKFAGTTLVEDGTNSITSAWDDGTVPTMEVTITRNRSVDVDPNKQYVLCMKTSDVFYFNGVPDVSTITGADEAVMIPNETPVVNRLIGGTLRQEKLVNFSAYSGEIRVKINPSTDVITITDIGISYNPALVGYTNGTQTIANPIDVQLVSVDGTKTLSDMGENDKYPLHKFPINSVDIKTAAAGGGLRVFNSMDNFSTYISGTTAKLGKDDKICYVVGSQKQTEMVYKELTFVLHIPYIEIDGEKHYLSFEETDTAITSNKKGNFSGYPLKNNTAASYDAEQHTITYEFENIYMTSWNNAVYTPTFGWPTELSDTEINEDYTVKELYWEVKQKDCYTGTESSFATRWPASALNKTTDTVFTSSTPEIVLQTDHDNPSKGLGVPMIYRDVNLETGYGGFLGFFDVHNEGAGDSPKVKIDITFNDNNGSGATYYVTRMVLPSDSSQVTVEYTLENTNGDKVSDKATYNVTSSFSCRIAELIQDYNGKHNSNLGDDYYIKELTYETVLRKNKLYHSEVIHSGRNSLGATGTFQGYMSGEVGQSAGATMTITSLDDSKLNKSGAMTLTATEISTISDLDFIANSFGTATLNGQSSTNITAGSDATLDFSVTVASEEYPIDGKVGGEINGYHVMRDGIFYVCLPEGVSIAGKDRVQINVGNGANKRTIDAEKVEKLTNTKCTINGTPAYWWKFEATGLNANGNATSGAGNIVYVSIKLSTDISMAGVNWSFNNCIAVGTNGQKLSRTGDSVTNKANTAAELRKLKFDSANALADYLPENADNLGLNLYRASASVNLNIARAEAKLDVATALSTTEAVSNNDQVTVSRANTSITYAVTVSCAEGGLAENFNYYIPIVHTNSALDTGALVSKREFGLTLTEEVDITPVNGTTATSPFEVYYTTDENLNSTTIQGNNVVWSKTLTDFSKVTAVKIATAADATVNEKEAYQFDVVMQYDNENSDFDKQAGSVVQWRSFGHYTYRTTGGAQTTNSYPSDDNSVRVRYEKDLTTDPIVMTLDTSDEYNLVSESKQLSTTFVKDQTLSIKEIKASSGTVLTTDDPSNFTGADANSKFRMAFNISDINDGTTLPNKGNGWAISANTAVTMQVGVRFSKALTDTTTSRYVDIVLGNDDINITCRVQLNRKVTAASADKSGVVVGENFIVHDVGQSCAISKDSSFTALYVVENFVPGNFSGQVLKWQNGNGVAADFPSGTTITMMEISSSNAVTSYWYCSPSGSSVDLNEFTRMAGDSKYSYDTTATASTTLRYMFVVNFGQAQAAAGSYKLVLDADAKDGVAAFTPVQLDVTLGETKAYGLAVSAEADVQKPTATVSYTVNEAEGNDSYSEGRSLSLVLSSQGKAALPQDAQIVVGDTAYSCNGTDHIIIPIGTVATGQKILALESQMFPEEAATYSFDAELYLSKSREDTAPMNGDRVAQCEITFTKSAESRPALSVTGTRVATLSDWVSGQDINISMAYLDGYEVTLNAYSGITGGQRVTNLLSSVSGVFTFKDGVGSYDSSKSQTGILTLNPDAKSGTYRLSFEVTKDGEKVLTVPYYIIVR